jgi:ankyrin repeat protein
MTRLLLAAGADTEYRDHNSDRAMIWAAHRGHAATVELLLEAGSPPDADLDPNGATPLMGAARYTHGDVVRLLLDSGADVMRRDQSQETALHRAALTDDVEIIRLLLDAGADPNAREEIFDETPLHVAALWSEPASIAALAAAGARIDARAREHETPLFIAAKSGNGRNVLALLAAGADPDARDASGRTPVLAAIGAVSRQPGGVLAAATLAEVSRDLDRALVAALQEGFAPIAFRLIERGADVNVTDEAGRSALAATTRFPGLTWFQLLINQGADLDSFGAETMLEAGAMAHALIARALLGRGIGVDVRDPRGASPLLLAAMNGHVAMVKLLLEAGADRSATDRSGAGIELYMGFIPAFYEGMIEQRGASRAYRPTDELEALLADIRRRHDEIRLLLAGG